ncbi:MAG: hypothetical protein HY454_02755 [Parcubacteria group bacterium]|nr:hypothetical protein [Parcubacteria group bacterium]
MKKLFLALALTFGSGNYAFAQNNLCGNLSPLRGEITCLAPAFPSEYLGSKVATILVHGINLESNIFARPKSEAWGPFIQFYLADADLKKNNGIYFFVYFSQATEGKNLGTKLGQELDKLNISDPNFGSRPIIFLGHSFGNLITREFVQNYIQRSGAWAGKLGGYRVIGWISFGGTFDGSPMANGPALYAKIPAVDEIKLLTFQNLFLSLGPTWNQPNRSDLRWSNRDGLLDYDRFPRERNLWLEELNADRTFDSKIVAYAGTLNQQSDCDSLDISSRVYCFGGEILKNIGLDSDGLVPVSSALFHDNNGKSRARKTRLLEGHNHDEVVQGKGDGVLLKSVKADLMEMVAATSSGWSTVTVSVDGLGSVVSNPPGIDCGPYCSQAFQEGTQVELDPSPYFDHVFAGWSGDADCYDGFVSVGLAPIKCQARFLEVKTLSRLGPDALDFNGDGRGEIFSYDPTTGQWEINFGGEFGQFNFVRGYGPVNSTVNAGDFNGDGLTDLFWYDPVFGWWAKATSDGKGGFLYFWSSWSPGWQVKVTDIDGDGRSDVFLYHPVTGQWFKCISLGLGGGEFYYVGGAWSAGWQIYNADFNGDRFADLFLYSPVTGQWFKAFGDGARGFNYESGVWSAGWQIYPGDYSGDRLTDLFLYNSRNGQWFVATNVPGGGFGYRTDFWSPGWSIETGDFDGNGLTDLLLYFPDRPEYFTVFSRSSQTFGYLSDTRGGIVGSEIRSADFNGDGYSDLVEYNSKFGTSVQWMNRGTGLFRRFTSWLFPNRVLITRKG